MAGNAVIAVFHVRARDVVSLIVDCDSQSGEASPYPRAAPTSASSSAGALGMARERFS